MKAIIQTKYGSPEVLKLKEIEKPVPGDDEVLVKVLGASVNFNNLIYVKGEPFVGRFWTGLFRPNNQTPGNDIAGKVEAVGKNITRFKAGDEVFGDISLCGFGAFSEYVCTSEKALEIKPANLTYEEAAAVPEASLVALQALRDAGRIQKGQKVLIYGASGGIGTFAVQIAKYYGAEVTGVCSTGNLEMVSSIGADHVIDYTSEDFTKNGRKYDLIISTAGYRSIFDYKRSLTPEGIYVSTGGKMKQVFQAMLLGSWISEKGGKKLGSYQVIPNKDLDFIKELIENGKVKPVIDRTYNSLGEVPAALTYYSQGHARGKVVIKLEG